MRTYILELWTHPAHLSHHLATAETLHVGEFADAWAANEYALPLVGDRAGKLVVRPLVELTGIEGRARWPHPLHVKASREANDEWAKLANNSFAQHNRRMAARDSEASHRSTWITA